MIMGIQCIDNKEENNIFFENNIFNSKLQSENVICLLIFSTVISSDLSFMCILIHVTMETNTRRGLAPALGQTSGEGQGSINLHTQKDVLGPFVKFPSSA